jgi:hypothetical protein
MPPALIRPSIRAAPLAIMPRPAMSKASTLAEIPPPPVYPIGLITAPAAHESLLKSPHRTIPQNSHSTPPCLAHSHALITPHGSPAVQPPRRQVSQSASIGTPTSLGRLLQTRPAAAPPAPSTSSLAASPALSSATLFASYKPWVRAKEAEAARRAAAGEDVKVKVTTDNNAEDHIYRFRPMLRLIVFGPPSPRDLERAQRLLRLLFASSDRYYPVPPRRLSLFTSVTFID